MNSVSYFSCVRFCFSFLDQFEKPCPSPFSSYQSLFDYISSLLKIVSWCSLILRKLSSCCNMALKKTDTALLTPPGLALLGQSSLSDSARQPVHAFSCCSVFAHIVPSAQNAFLLPHSLFSHLSIFSQILLIFQFPVYIHFL